MIYSDFVVAFVVVVVVFVGRGVLADSRVEINFVVATAVHV